MSHDHGHTHDHPSSTEHRSIGDGWLRAAVFGASDGLVSNTALVLGVATGSGDPGSTLLAGVAGLMAGAASMAAGEWISVKAQREALERELARERDHLERYPVAERDHICSLLQRAGLSEPVARQVVHEIEQEPEQNLHFHARLELGIDPRELGSPVRAAGASFLAFSVGAAVPLAPWLVWAEGWTIGSVVLSTLAAFAVGSALARYTARSWWVSGLRQVIVGVAAAAITMSVGALLGAIVA